MFVDASTLVAILLGERGFKSFAVALDGSEAGHVTPFVIMEAGLAVMRETPRGAEVVFGEIEHTLGQFRIRTAELTSPMILTALKAYEHYGKGRHPARLNMGDCLSYGAARMLGLPLLYKGQDFALTDIPSALA